MEWLRGIVVAQVGGQAVSCSSGRADRPCKRFHARNFSRIIFKRGKGIHCHLMLDEFVYRGSASLILAFMG